MDTLTRVQPLLGAIDAHDVATIISKLTSSGGPCVLCVAGWGFNADCCSWAPVCVCVCARVFVCVKSALRHAMLLCTLLLLTYSLESVLTLVGGSV